MWVFGYALIYFPWWLLLEGRANLPYHVINTPLDRIVPFCEYFIIPYYMWFLYVPAVFIYLLLKDKERKNFYRYAVTAFSGMTIFLIVCTFYPNGHLLRPAVFERHNIFTALVQILYHSDTATNIFPSMHVYVSIAAHIAVLNCRELREKPVIRIGSASLMVLIILSTVFLKQHSLVDVAGGILLALLMDQLVYHTDHAQLLRRIRAYREKMHRRITA